MRKLQDDGKIRSIGVSAEDWEWEGSVRIAESEKIDSIQAIYNVFDRQPEDKLFPVVLEHNIGIIVRVPLFEGLLAGKIRPGHTFAEGDWRKDFLTEDRLREADKHLAELEQLLDEENPTLADLSLKFILSHPAVSTVIVGMTNPKYVDANCAVSGAKPLSQEKLAALKAQRWDHGWVYPWDRRNQEKEQ